MQDQVMQDPAEFTDQQILDYERQIKDESNSNAPLISTLLSLDTLKPEYINADPTLKSKADILFNSFTSFRRVKKDGNCFYRGFGFSIAEQILSKPTHASTKEFKLKLINSKQFLVDSGYDLMAIEDFYDLTVELMTTCKNMKEFEVAFEEGYQSDAMVCYFRLLCAAVLKRNSSFYEMFLEQGIDQFVATQVEPMYIEADNIQIAAIAEYFMVKVVVVTLDASVNFKPQEISQTIQSEKLGSGDDALTAQLFFKPGHYDLIY